MNVLFICTGNTCRSPMAEGIFNKISKEQGKNIKVDSAGIFAMEGTNISENAVKALEEIDIDISGKKSKKLTKDMLKEADLILGMSKGHAYTATNMVDNISEKVFTLNEYSFDGNKKDIEDPYGQDLETYKKTRDEILKAIKNIFLTKEDFK